MQDLASVDAPLGVGLDRPCRDGALSRVAKDNSSRLGSVVCDVARYDKLGDPASGRAALTYLDSIYDV